MFKELLNKLTTPKQSSGKWVNGKFVPNAPKDDRPLDIRVVFDVAGVGYRTNDIQQLTTLIKKWGMTTEQLKEKYPDREIYKYYYKNEPVELVPEPDNPHDPNAIKVLINNVHVGYVPKSSIQEVNAYYEGGEVKVKAQISGGEFKIVNRNGEVSSYCKPISIKITLSR